MASDQTESDLTTPLAPTELAEIEREHRIASEGFDEWGVTGSQGGEAHRHRGVLLAEIRRLIRPHPIAEAPKDGTRILAYMPSTETWMVLVWLVRKACWACPDFPHVGYYDPACFFSLPAVKL